MNITDGKIRMTHYFNQYQIDCITYYAAFSGKRKSQIVQEAIENYIPDKYKKLASDPQTD